MSDHPPGGRAPRPGADRRPGTQPPAGEPEAAQAKAAVLCEALPWITRFHGSKVVIKYGGNVLADEDLTRSFAEDIALLHFVGLKPVVVHGGGPQISELAARLGIESRFVDGLRVTDEATMDVVRMVLLGRINPQLVGFIQAAGAPAIGIAGTDARLLTVRTARGPAGEDLGQVGEVASVDATVLTQLLDDGLVPVLATVGRDETGTEHNVNADTAAGAVAAALGATKLVYLTDVSGLYGDLGQEGSLISETTVEHLADLLENGRLHAGMRPKVASIVSALRRGVPHAHILDGGMLHAVLLEVFTDAGVGTMVTAGDVHAGSSRPEQMDT